MKPAINTKWIYRLFVFIFAFCVIVTTFLFSLQSILDRSSVKSLVREKIQSLFQLDVVYDEIGTVMFPIPGIQISGLHIKDGDLDILTLESAIIRFHVVSLLKGEFYISYVSLDNGQIFIARDEVGAFTIVKKFKADSKEVEESKEKVEEGPKSLFAILPRKLHIQNIKLRYEDKQLSIQQNASIDTLEVSLDPSELSLRLNLVSEFEGNSILLSSITSIEGNEWNLDSLRTKTSLTIPDFKLSTIDNITKVFPLGDFKESTFQLEMNLDKVNQDQVHILLDRLSLIKVKNKRGQLLPELLFTSDTLLTLPMKQLMLNDLSFRSGTHSEIKVSGTTAPLNQSHMILKVGSDRMDIDRLKPIIDTLSNVELQKSPYFSSHSNPSESTSKIESQTPAQNNPIEIDVSLALKNFRVKGYHLAFINGPVVYKGDFVKFNDLAIGMYDGTILSKGEFNLRKSQLIVNSDIKRLNVEKAIRATTNDEILKGTLRGNAYLDLDIKKQMLASNGLKLRSTFHIDKGQLLGYANFIKPVAEVGKLFNFEGGKGNSTSFDSIDGEVLIQNSNVNLKSFSMKGVGLNANGNGVIQKSGAIDMRFTLALSGYLGKAIKLPIIYKGIYGKNLAYIDPVWLATVYTGTMIGGPVGTVIGSMAGSNVSEKVDQTISKVGKTFGEIKGFFFDEKDETSKKETKSSRK